MCGISGILDFGAPDGQRSTTLRSMIQAIEHRGPDGCGFHEQGPVGLAHARLSIIDLSFGDQPIANEDRTVWVVFNGEIFNYLELRADLEALGHKFSTQSDTETIVHAYEEYGHRFLEHLNGQFAIALWDQTREKLILARDRVGIRPLFYCHDGGRLIFASEIKALRPALRRPLHFSTRSLAQIFTFWSATGNSTAFEGIHSLQPGMMLIADRNGERLERYWQWSELRPFSSMDFEEAAHELRRRLVDAVRLQLRADVPVGAYLSGGLDSSGIVALIRGFTSTPVRTFSVGFEDAEFDESEHQQAMARFLGTEHSTIRCSTRQIGEHFPRFVQHAETPVVRTAPVPLMLLSGLVRQSGYKVVLTGEGADEVFGGYDLFKEAKIRRFWAREPTSRSRAALLTRLYPYLTHSPVGSSPLAGTFYGQGLGDLENPFYAHGPRWATTRRIWNLLSKDVRSSLQGYDVTADLKADLPHGFDQWEGLARDQFAEASTLLSGYLLSSQGDRVAMASSIEGRFPYLDHTVIEFANRLPARYKLKGLQEKALLRRALEPLLPQDIVRRVKQPYRAPDSRSFFVDGRPLDYVEELLRPGRVTRSGLFDAAAVSRLTEKCRTGRAIGFSDNMAFVAILSTMLLDEAFAG